MNLDAALAELPVIAILRGLTERMAVDVAAVLIDCGIRAVEAPLNSPGSVASIARMADRFAGQAAVGAGTVLTPQQVGAVADAGAVFTVSPNTDGSVIAASVDAGMAPVPGFATPSEAFCALNAGARYLKLFPCDAFGPAYLKALNAVLPADSRVIAVGGITEANMQPWLVAGVAGFGIGSFLYRPERNLGSLREAAKGLVATYLSIVQDT